MQIPPTADVRQRPTRRPAGPGCHVRGRTQASAYDHAAARCLTTLSLARSSGATVVVCAHAELLMPKSSARPCQRGHTTAGVSNTSAIRHSNHATPPNQPPTQSCWPTTPVAFPRESVVARAGSTHTRYPIASLCMNDMPLAVRLLASQRAGPTHAYFLTAEHTRTKRRHAARQQTPAMPQHTK